MLLVLQFTMSEAALEAWGWRIPFAIGAVLAVVVFYIRRRLAETESFEKAKASQAPRSSGANLFRDHPKAAFLVMALTAGGTLAFYAYTTYMQKFLVNTSGFDRQTASQVMTAALFVFMCIQPLSGALSDRIGRKPVMVTFGLLGVLLTVPIFTALEQVEDPIAAFGLVMAALLIVTGYTSINAVVKAELFPSHIRALGVGFALCARQHPVRRHRRICRALVQGAGHGARLLLVRDRDDRPVADRLSADARHQAPQPDRGGLSPLPLQERGRAAPSKAIGLDCCATFGRGRTSVE